jgi:hypothetical protein
MSEKPAIPMPTAKLGEGTAEFRVAAALEYITFYLDRIDGHLETLASRSANSQLAQINNSLGSIRMAIQARR